MILDRQELESLHRDLAPTHRIDLAALTEAGRSALEDGRLEDASEVVGIALVATPGPPAVLLGAFSAAPERYRRGLAGGVVLLEARTWQRRTGKRFALLRVADLGRWSRTGASERADV